MRPLALTAALVLLTAACCRGGSTGTLEVAHAHDRRGFGWQPPEANLQHWICWMDEYEADLVLVCGPPRDRTLEVSCAPLFYPFRRQNVGVFVNRSYAGEWVCPHAPDFRTYTIEVPADLWQPGTNTLTLRVGYLRRMPPDPRELGLSVERIRWWPR